MVNVISPCDYVWSVSVRNYLVSLSETFRVVL